MKDEYLDLVEDETTRLRRDQFDDSLRRTRLARTPLLGSKLAADDKRPALEHLQNSCDRLFQMAGTIMPGPGPYDDLDEYRVKIANSLQHRLPKKIDVPSWMAREPQALDRLESNIAKVVEHTAHTSPVLKPITFRDQTGRSVVEFIGQSGMKTTGGWMTPWVRSPQLMTKIGGVSVGRTAELGA